MIEHTHLESLYPDISRHWEIEQILSYVKRGESCEMIAFPGVGRGNVFKFLCYNRNIRIKHLGQKQAQYHFVFINFAEVKNRDLFDITKFIFLQLVTSLHERLFIEEFNSVDKLFRKYLSYKDDLVLFEGLKEAIDYLVHERNLHIILLLERLELYIPRLSEDFFINLRSLRDNAKYKFSVVFSTTRLLEEAIEHNILANYYEFFAGKHVYLQLCDLPGILFRVTYLEKIVGKIIDASIKKELLRLTGGHGKLTRLGMEAILAEGANQIKGDLTAFLLSHKTIQQALKEIWDFLTPAEQQLVVLVSVAHPGSLNACTTDERDSGQVRMTTSFLENIGLIKNNLLTIPLFAYWIKKHRDQPEENIEQITYDPETNTIKRGNIVFSDLLTSSEFRLLRYLLENPNKVLERDNIIYNVWKNNVTTLGVTDQAFDQLLFRLRKKIEPNHSETKIIETLKGKGVRYNSNYFSAKTEK